MKKKLFFALTAALIAIAPVANHAAAADQTAKHERFKNMTPEQREKLRAEHKAKWDAMTKQEKVDFLNKKHAERAAKGKEFNDKWSKMTDDEKIAKHEERMKRHRS